MSHVCPSENRGTQPLNKQPSAVVDTEARIAELRLPGLLRMIAAAENRALKIEVEKGAAEAAPARAQVERYRQALARLQAPDAPSAAAAPAPSDQARAELAQVQEELTQARR